MFIVPAIMKAFPYPIWKSLRKKNHLYYSFLFPFNFAPFVHFPSFSSLLSFLPLLLKSFLNYIEIIFGRNKELLYIKAAMRLVFREKRVVWSCFSFLKLNRINLNSGQQKWLKLTMLRWKPRKERKPKTKKCIAYLFLTVDKSENCLFSRLPYL